MGLILVGYDVMCIKTVTLKTGSTGSLPWNPVRILQPWDGDADEQVITLFCDKPVMNLESNKIIYIDH
jgi:hypothetical protein